MTKPSYAYAVGNIRAKEHTLLTKNDIEQLISQNNITDFINMLSDKGYTLSQHDFDVDNLIAKEEEKLWSYLFSVVPDKNLFDVFLVSNDFHNMKVTLKGTIRSRKYEHIILKPCKVSPETVRTAVEEKKFYLLPDYMQTALKEAYDILTKTHDVQLSDGVLDKACMEKQIELSDKSGSATLYKYFSAVVFYNNMKIALRAAKANKRANFLDDTLCDMKEFNLASLKNAALSGQEAVLDYMTKLNIFDSARLAQSFKESSSLFERDADNYLMSVIREGKYISLGCEPVVGFLLAKQTEFLVIKILAFGIRAKKPADETRERLRVLYE